MKNFIKFFIILAVLGGVFTAWQYVGRTGPTLMKMEKATVKVEKRLPHPPPEAVNKPTTEVDIQKERTAAAEAEAALRKEKREDLKLYLGFATTLLSSIVSIVLAIINRKKD